ncbi:MAG: hypothetical protein ACYC91_13635 [Solirubrobacteraceae bacterium]
MVTERERASPGVHLGPLSFSTLEVYTAIATFNHIDRFNQQPIASWT